MRKNRRYYDYYHDFVFLINNGCIGNVTLFSSISPSIRDHCNDQLTRTQNRMFIGTRESVRHNCSWNLGVSRDHAQGLDLLKR
jgi:hypothetical protein